MVTPSYIANKDRVKRRLFL